MIHTLNSCELKSIKREDFMENKQLTKKEFETEMAKIEEVEPDETDIQMIKEANRINNETVVDFNELKKSLN